MPALPRAAEPAATAPPRCFGCAAPVAGTRHTRTGWVIGGYALHTGRTVDATIRRREDEAPLTYRRLVEPLELVACPACFARPDVRRLWLAFGGDAPGSALRPG
jgi:hypothetical protein